MIKLPLNKGVCKDEDCLDLLENLIGLIESRDPNLEGHSINVKNLTSMLYDMLPFRIRSRLNLDMLLYAAILLDLGKLALPKEIVNKGGKLEENERMIMQRHPEIGAEILSRIKPLKSVAEWIKFHHERVDGHGYHHLKGKEIPLESRILAVADTFSALMMDRNYKSSLSYPEAITELKLVAGTQLDAEIVEYFCRIPPKKIEKSMKKIKLQMESYIYKDDNNK